MKKPCTRLFSLLLALIMLAVSTVSCAESSEESAPDSASPAEEAAETAPAEEPEDVKILPELPADLNYDGAEIRIMQHPHQTGDWSDWLSRDLFAESYTGEPINDAVFDRNAYVSDRLNVSLNVIDVADQPTAIKLQVTGGTDDYHISSARIQSLPATVMAGYLINLNKVPNIDLAKPWYDQKCIDDAQFFNQLYYICGSMMILDDDSTGAMVFNKQLITDYSLEMPYDLVTEGTWTLNKMSDMANAVASDVNGNGDVDIEGDRFGLLWQRDAIISYMHGAGCRIVEKDASGEPSFILGDERSVNLFDKLDAIMFDPRVVQNMHNYSSIYPDIYAGECNIFRENNALFMWVRMRVVENLRDMEADFGIIPVPKLDEAQSDYYSTVTKYTAATTCIPNVAAFDLSMVGAVVETMSAEGHYGLREAYYEKNLGTKVARDPQSTEMLDLIIASRVYDAGEIYAIGAISDQLYALSTGSQIGLTTLIAKNQKIIEKNMDRNFLTPLKTLAEQGN